MIVYAASDIHARLPEIPPCDLLLIGGDISLGFDYTPHRSAEWLDTKIRKWLDSIPARKIIFTPGNHDHIFQEAPDKVPVDLRWEVLIDKATTFEGLKVYGTPWQLEFGGWAFNLEEYQLKEKFQAIPDDTDIVLAHSPPFGIGDHAPSDEVAGIGDETTYLGSPSLRKRLDEIKPKLAVFGHIHQGHGVYPQPHGGIYVNASIVAGGYKVTNKPILIELTTNPD